jgi:hypothetical protein
VLQRIEKRSSPTTYGKPAQVVSRHTRVAMPPDSIPENFKPEWQFFAAFGAIGIVSLAAALDPTSFFVALPANFTLKI